MTVVLTIVVKVIIREGVFIYILHFLESTFQRIHPFHYGVENPTTSLEHFEGNSMKKVNIASIFSEKHYFVPVSHYSHCITYNIYYMYQSAP